MLISFCEALFGLILLGEGRQGRGGGGIHLFGDGPVEGVAVEEGYFLRHLFGSEGWTVM